MATETAALILSAGSSRRLGGEPKALLPVDGRAGVRRIAEVCLADGFEPVIVVVGPHRHAIARELQGLDVELVDSDQGEDARTGSVQTGLAALPAERDVLFWPVDHPFVRPRTLDVLLAARDTDLLGVWFLPTFEGRGGHPVLWRPSVRAEIFDLRPDAPLRALLPELGPQVRRVAVDDPGVIANVDTPEEYRHAVADWRSREAL
jgi:molybdenum cofactor cytidylyltransferase